MAYGEYKNSGRSPGKILYQLSKIGIPLQIVESVILDYGKVTLTYCNKPFATYLWSIDDTPVFTFEGEYRRYNDLKQPKFMELKDLLEERENMKAALLFYSYQTKQLVDNHEPMALSNDIGNVADFCLGKEIPNDNLHFVKSVLSSCKYIAEHEIT